MRRAEPAKPKKVEEELPNKKAQIYKKKYIKNIRTYIEGADVASTRVIVYTESFLGVHIKYNNFIYMCIVASSRLPYPQCFQSVLGWLTPPRFLFAIVKSWSCIWWGLKTPVLLLRA